MTKLAKTNHQMNFDEKSDLAFVWDANNTGAGGYQPGTFGLAFLESPGIPNDNKDNDDDGLTDERRDNMAMNKVGPYDGITDLAKFLEYYGMKEEDLKEHWDADEDQDWQDGYDENGNGVYDNGEFAGDDVGLDGVGPTDLNYYFAKDFSRNIFILIIIKKSLPDLLILQLNIQNPMQLL